MGNPYPVHTCTVGPFDSYHSNVVNRLTGLVSNYEDCIFSADKIDVIQDSASEVTISAGSVFKDDVFVNIEDITIDFSDPDFYAYHSAWDEIGYYYILLYYAYAKSRPAPKPSIQILKPSERDSFVPGPTSSWVFLKAAYVDIVGANLEIVSLWDYDPENVTIRRIYSKTYVGLEDSQPIFSFSRDFGRVVITGDELYYGGLTSWITIPSEIEIENLRTFVGANGPTDTTPDYTSIRHITQNNPLETAISELDVSIGYSDLKKTINDNSSTPSILSLSGKVCGLLQIANTVATNITHLTDAPLAGAHEAIIIILRFNNSNTTIKNGAHISLSGGYDFNGTGGAMLALVRLGEVWHEIFRNTVGATRIFLLGKGEQQIYWTGSYGGTGGKFPSPIPLPAGTYEASFLGSLYISSYVSELTCRIRGISGASNIADHFNGYLRFGVGPFAGHRILPYGVWDTGDLSRLFYNSAGGMCDPVTHPAVAFTASTAGDPSFTATFDLDVTLLNGSYDLGIFMYPSSPAGKPFWVRIWSWELWYK